MGTASTASWATTRRQPFTLSSITQSSTSSNKWTWTIIMATTSNLMTLGHPNPSQFNAQDVQQLRSLVVWLKDNHVKSGAGEGFRDTYAANWQVNFDAYPVRRSFLDRWSSNPAKVCTKSKGIERTSVC